MTFPAYGQNSFTRGEALFVQNKPQEALIFLEAAVIEDPAHVRAFLYLGIAYQQLNRIDDAINTYRRILPRGGAETARIAFNLGNAYLSKGNQPSAVQSYSQALSADPGYSSALLNRANAQIQMGSLKEAVTDYENYLLLEPMTSQRANIEELIALIRAEQLVEEQRRQEEEAKAELARQEAIAAEERRIAEEKAAEEQRIAEEKAAEERRIAEEAAAAEQRRIAAEEAERRRQEEAAAAEQRRIAAAEAARQEAERRQRLLDEVAAALQAAAEDSRGLSAGNEGIQGYDGEFVLE
jgi:tetratricopeptide (TPR) repeat protein